MFQRPTPRNEEIKLDPSRLLVSKTDAAGIITYANDYFVEVVGYSINELVGQPHNIIRHPDMPKIAFKLMWDRINAGKNFKALVKNLAKDGRYYWVITDFEPKYDPVSGKIISHTAYRKAPLADAVQKIIPVYQKLVELEREGGMRASSQFLDGFLSSRNLDYDGFIDEISSGKHTSGILSFAKKLFGK